MSFPNFNFENNLFKKGYKYIAGMDEAGRGAWAGPIVCACVIFDKKVRIQGINDSKKISLKKRQELYSIIINRALCFSVGICDINEINNSGIGKAHNKAFLNAINNLKIRPDYLLVDFFRLKNTDIPFDSIIKGDSKSISIAAASIIAKVTRDSIMIEFSKRYPNYFFEKHKGYGTSLHDKSLKEYGVCEIHRKNYKPIIKYMQKQLF